MPDSEEYKRNFRLSRRSMSGLAVKTKQNIRKGWACQLGAKIVPTRYGTIPILLGKHGLEGNINDPCRV